MRLIHGSALGQFLFTFYFVSFQTCSGPNEVSRKLKPSIFAGGCKHSAQRAILLRPRQFLWPNRRMELLQPGAGVIQTSQQREDFENGNDFRFAPQGSSAAGNAAHFNNCHMSIAVSCADVVGFRKIADCCSSRQQKSQPRFQG